MYIKNKLIHYNLNLDYSLNFLSIEQQTNMLINKVINDFINKYEKDFNKKIFVFEFNDDLISTIGYKILIAISAIKPEFNFTIYGKAKKAKKQINYKKEKFISKRKLKKNKDNIIFISSFNPIYKVANLNRSSIDFIIPNFYLFNQFTYQEILMAQQFYGIGYIKDHELNPKFNNSIEEFNNWINNPKNQINIEDYCAAPQKITLIWIEDNGYEENNIKIMQEVEQSDNLIFYYYDQVEIPNILQDRNFIVLLKKTTNRPNEKFLNLNNYELPIKFLLKYNNIEIEFKGNWSQENKDKFKRSELSENCCC